MTDSTALQIQGPDMAKVQELGTQHQLEAEQVLGYIKTLSPETLEDLHFALKAVATVKLKHTEYDGQRKEHGGPLRKVVEEVNANFKPGLEFLAEAESILKGKIVDFVVDWSERRAAKLLEASELAEKGEDATALIEAAAEFEVPKIPGLSIRETWTGEVVDAKKIPKKYMKPDVKALEDLTKEKKGDPGVKGWRAFVKTNATVTPSKVKLT